MTPSEPFEPEKIPSESGWWWQQTPGKKPSLFRVFVDNGKATAWTAEHDRRHGVEPVPGVTWIRCLPPEVALSATMKVVAERDDALRELRRMAQREEHFASVLRVADGGQYRNDWDGSIRRVLRERRAFQSAALGSPAPPHDQEIRQHLDRGGGWAWSYGDDLDGAAWSFHDVQRARDQAIELGQVWTWRKVDKRGRPFVELEESER